MKIKVYLFYVILGAGCMVIVYIYICL